MSSYHSLLQRQINRILKSTTKFSSEFNSLFSMISETYQHYENDRVLQERSMELSSKELTEANLQLSKDIEQQKQLLITLESMVSELSYEDYGEQSSAPEKGNLLSLAEVIRSEIQKRKNADANLVALLNNTSDSIWSVNQLYELVSFNSAFEKKSMEIYKALIRIGMRPEDIFGIGTTETKIWRAYYLRALKGERFVHDRKVKKDGAHFDFEVSCSPIISEGKIVGVTIFERNITERKKSEEEIIRAKDAAEAASRAKSEFLANMSHELRTPLNAIIGYSELICENIEDNQFDLVDQDANRIRAAGKHLLELINEILDLSKIEAGKMEADIEQFDVKELVNHLETVTGYLIEKNGNKFKIKSNFSIHFFHSDRGKLTQILFNLISNAAKFTNQGEVSLNVQSEIIENKTGLRFDIQDSGIGIPKDKIDRLFKPFSQVDSSTTRKYGGTGLGLMIVKKYTELLGGNVSFQSEFGKGSTFSIWIPDHQESNSSNQNI